MPLRKNSLISLVKTKPIADYRQLCFDILKQIFNAFNYLANNNLVYRNLKPDNIFYYTLLNNGNFYFQLADFRLTYYRSLTKTFYGTGYY